MTMTEVKSMVWRYFYSYWNNRRICSAIGGIAPMAKRKLYFDSLDDLLLFKGVLEKDRIFAPCGS